MDLEPESIRNEKVKVLKSLRLFDKESAQKNIVRGQYGRGIIGGVKFRHIGKRRGFLKIQIQTHLLPLKINVDNFRWAGVPFYVKTGKRLDKKTTRIIVQFKKLPGINFYKNLNNGKPNLW